MRLVAAATERWTHTVAADVPLGNIYRRFRLPGQVEVVLPVGIISVAILGISW